MSIRPLNTELNPICHLLALLEAHHILNISRIRVNLENVHFGVSFWAMIEGVLLTVHLSIILVMNQLNTQILVL